MAAALSQTALARWASVEQPTMANTLNRMERDGLIVRTPDPDDRRSALISLTKLGRQRASEALDSAHGGQRTSPSPASSPPSASSCSTCCGASPKTLDGTTSKRIATGLDCR